jgi:hypothetical protein
MSIDRRDRFHNCSIWPMQAFIFLHSRFAQEQYGLSEFDPFTHLIFSQRQTATRIATWAKTEPSIGLDIFGVRLARLAG